MDVIAATKEEADAHLNHLHKERGFDGQELRHSVLVSSLDEALNILSDQLYQKPTHFLLELIQNADDNSYAAEVSPSLHLSLYRRNGLVFFRTDCNEVGFTLKQLDALTRVGHSTKKSTAGGQKGYIGEKGIGFKSVFKVTDVVHIASGFYEFKLDRNQPIGMILPIPSSFPSADRVANHTQFCLELKYDFSAILQDLENIEPQLMMFLRKLKTMHISTPSVDKVYHHLTYKNAKTFGGELHLISEEAVTPGTNKTRIYVVHRHTVRRVGQDPRREGITTSEVVVAFAVRDIWTPAATFQKIFAFLPVGHFGFRFLIHADFILLASRENVEYMCPWNLALRDGIRDAFVEAINRFALLPDSTTRGGLCYSWPKYLLRQTGYSEFWNSLYQTILNALCNQKVLRSRNGLPFQEPWALRYVPKSYRFGDGTLFDLPYINRSHLSFAYDHVQEELSLIGVSTLTIDELCGEFGMWIEEVGVAGIKGKSTEWHRNVSHLFCYNRTLKNRLQRFPIIPLRDGSWVSAKGEHVYLASQNVDEHVPAGVSISIVDQNACQDTVRRRFFEFLGIEEYSARQVCSLILELHHPGYTHKKARGKKDLVADAAYLFKNRSQFWNNSAPTMYFVVQRDGQLGVEYGSSSQIYLLDPVVQPSLILKYRNTNGNPFAVLLDEYETTVCKGEAEGTAKQFREWLLRSESLCFATVPTLVRGTELTPEWEFLKNKNIADLLHAVKFHCEKSNVSLKLLEAVPELEVPCLDGATRALGLVAVPTTTLKRRCPHLYFARLPSPTRENWGFLSRFGVLTTCNTTASLRELQALSELPADSVDQKVVHDIYRALNLDSSVDTNKNKIRRAFQNSPLVLITKPNLKWSSHSPCVWTAPAPLKRITSLKKCYSDCKTLFCELLGVTSATTIHVVNEFCSISDEASQALPRFEELFSLLQRFHSDKSELDVKQIKRVRGARVFPILEERSASITLRSVDDGNWYIPDKATLGSAFIGKVDMLSVPVKLVKAQRGLFADLGCGDLFLSVAVQETVKPRGVSIRDELREDDLKTRFKFISQLAADDSSLLEVLPALRVWSVPSITMTRRLGDVEVVDDHELITIKENDEAINIYFREDIQEFDQPTVNYELVDYFISELGISVKEGNLVSLLMSAPINQLPEIMEKHDISLPEGSDSEDTDREDEDVEAVDQHEEPPDGEPNLRMVEDDKDRRGYETNKTASNAAGSGATSDGFSSFSPTHLRHLQPLGELIPSHQSMTERIIKNASRFIMSDALVARTPIQRSKLEGLYGLSLPIRTKTTRDSEGERSSVTPLTSTPISHGRSIYEPRTEITESHFSNHQIPRLSPGLSPPGTRTKPVPARDIRYREIGFLGELFVHELFERQIDDWTFQSWTSKMRVEAGHPRFTELEKNFSDFTYLDCSGHMKEVLRQAGIKPNAEWSSTTTFHLEVKTTLGSCEEAFFVSQNQLDKMRYFDGDPNNGYVLLRVFNVEEGDCPGIKFFRDPWSLYMDKTLDFRSEQGYKVYEGEEFK